MAEKILLEPDRYYHIFNHAIGDELMFGNERDYLNFFERYRHFVSPCVETLAYCLMSNHFHIAIKIKSICQLLENIRTKTYDKIDVCIYRSISNCLNGYVQWYNNKYDRIGGLFVGNFKRKPLHSDDDLRRCISYINNNPVEAGITANPEEWPYSSYQDVVSGQRSDMIPIWKEELMRIFDDIENFKYYHSLQLKTQVDYDHP